MSFEQMIICRQDDTDSMVSLHYGVLLPYESVALPIKWRLDKVRLFWYNDIYIYIYIYI